MNAPTEPNDPKTAPSNELSLAILEATLGLKEAAHSLTTLTQKTERAHKPASIRRGLSRTEAAEYIGISGTKFGQLVQEKRMPAPKKIDGRNVWDVYALDAFFDALDPVEDAGAQTNPWN